jgi:hypothetical protein
MLVLSASSSSLHLQQTNESCSILAVSSTYHYYCLPLPIATIDKQCLCNIELLSYTSEKEVSSASSKGKNHEIEIAPCSPSVVRLEQENGNIELPGNSYQWTTRKGQLSNQAVSCYSRGKTGKGITAYDCKC